MGGGRGGGELTGTWCGVGLFLKKIEYCVTIKFIDFNNSKFKYNFNFY